MERFLLLISLATSTAMFIVFVRAMCVLKRWRTTAHEWRTTAEAWESCAKHWQIAAQMFPPRVG